ncbi:hypothetical protein JB92DRAFT_2689302, partial [Gautieria morchelliformis]
LQPMPPVKATPLNLAPNSANINTPTPSKPGSPSTRMNPSPNLQAGTSPIVIQPENISNPHELTAFVETVLSQLESNFDELSTQVLDRMSQMSSRIDSLESSIQELLSGDIGSTPSSPTPGTPAVRPQSLRGSTQ